MPISTHDRMLPDALLRADAYPWRPRDIELIETHVSWVVLAGNFVIKIKRPVDLGFVDHTALAARRASCVAEVHLNRRLTDGVYLDAIGIMSERGTLVVDGVGEVVEWATLMRRLPATGMLDGLLQRNSAPPDLADRLADRLIPFHTRTAPVVSAAQMPVSAQLDVVTDNLDQLRLAAAGLVSMSELALIDDAIRGFIHTHRALFEARSRDGFVRDGHGDLRCEHVCLEHDHLQIFDCVEFNRELRCSDIASDLAFLLLDLRRLGAAVVADELLARYRAAGIDLPDPLLRFYAAHRALVRAKVDCIARNSGNPARRTALERNAEAYLHLAVRHAAVTHPAVIVLTGLSGSGKSTVAGEIARMTGAEIIATDVVRKRLAGTKGVVASEWQSGIYTRAWTERTYATVLAEAAEIVRAGRPVIIDGAFLQTRQRESAAKAAATAGVSLIFFEATCSDATAMARITTRENAGTSISDAGPEIFAAQRTAQANEPPGMPVGASIVAIDTEADESVQTDRIVDALRAAGILVPGMG